jgi:ATP-dependent DNA helicase RecG
VQAVAGQKAQHIRNRGFDSQYCRYMIVTLVRAHQPVPREDIDKLLLDKLPEVLIQKQRLARIHNLLSSLSGTAKRNACSRAASQWVLIEKTMKNKRVNKGAVLNSQKNLFNFNNLRSQSRLLDVCF